MNCITSFVAALILSSCAVTSPASKPVLRAPEVLEVDFTSISEGQAAPHSGLLLTDERADAMLRGMRRLANDAQVKLIDATAKADVLQLQLSSALEQVRQGETDRMWALAAKIGIGGLAVGAVAALVAVVVSALR